MKRLMQRGNDVVLTNWTRCFRIRSRIQNFFLKKKINKNRRKFRFRTQMTEFSPYFPAMNRIEAKRMTKSVNPNYPKPKENI